MATAPGRSRGSFRRAGLRASVRRCWVVAALSACASPDADRSAGQVATLLARSAAAWNRGDLDGFMAGYAHDSVTSFLSGGHVQYGWERLYARYREAYFAPGRSRDSLSFAEARVRVLAPTVAFYTARFALHRGDSLVASGPFTLILERRGDRWLIIHDHTSADPR